LTDEKLPEAQVIRLFRQAAMPVAPVLLIRNDAPLRVLGEVQAGDRDDFAAICGVAQTVRVLEGYSQ
jgi:hypothetical protein